MKKARIERVSPIPRIRNAGAWSVRVNDLVLVSGVWDVRIAFIRRWHVAQFVQAL